MPRKQKHNNNTQTEKKDHFNDRACELRPVSFYFRFFSFGNTNILLIFVSFHFNQNSHTFIVVISCRYNKWSSRTPIAICGNGVCVRYTSTLNAIAKIKWQRSEWDESTVEWTSTNNKHSIPKSNVNIVCAPWNHFILIITTSADVFFPALSSSFIAMMCRRRRRRLLILFSLSFTLTHISSVYALLLLLLFFFHLSSRERKKVETCPSCFRME